MTIRLDVLGPPRLLDSRGEPLAIPPGKPLALLIALACSDDGWSRADLATLLWPSSERGRARQSVRQALWFLRNRLGGGVLNGDDPVLVDREALVTDRSRFVELLQAGILDEAATLWRGPFLEGFAAGGGRAWEEWVERTREDLGVRYRGALRVAADSRRASGDASGALPWLRKAAALMPRSEEGWADLVSVALEAQLPVDAVEALEEARASLLGFQEGGTLAALEEQVRAALRAQGSGAGGGARPSLDLVGRGAELRHLVRLWHRARDGDGQVVILSGASGIGKTRLVDEFGTAVRLQGGQVVRIRGHHGESRLPWGVAADLIRHLLDAPGAAAISPTSDILLRSLVPTVARREGSSPAEERGPEPQALAEAFVDLLLNVAYEEPILLVLDDLHRGDAESRALFLRACRRITDASCMVVLVDRRTPTGAAGRTADLDALLEREGSTSIVLHPLTVEDVASALARAIRIPGTGEVSRIAGRLHGVSRGNPLVLMQLLGRLADDGILVSSFPGSGWSLDPASLPDELPPPDPAQRQVEGGGVGFPLDLRRGAVGGDGDQERPAHSDPLRPAPRPGRWLPAAMALATLGFAAAILFQAGSRSSAYPAGAVLLHGSGSAWELQPPAAIREGWRLKPSQRALPVHEDAMPWLREDGSISWVARVKGSGSTSWVGVWNGSDWEPVWREEQADADYVAVAPGGGLLTGVRQSMDEPGPRHDLWAVDLERGASTILHRAEEAIRRRGSWSPDGSRIAVVLRGSVDTLLTLSPSGGGVRRTTLPGSVTLSAPAWCEDGEHLGLLAERNGTLRPLLLHTPSGGVTPLDGGPGSGSASLCLGTPPVFLYHGVHEGEMWLLEAAPHRATAAPLALVGTDLPRLDWLPARPPARLRAVRIDPSPSPVRPGEPRHLQAVGELGDGQHTGLEVAWTSRDPEVASVTRDGILTGVRPGVTWVRARYRDWLADSVQITVDGGAGEGGVPWDTLDEFDSAPWLHFEWPDPGPGPIQREGEHALRGGGGVPAPGRLLADPLEPSRGLTVELEFRIPLHDPGHEPIIVGLVPALPSGGLPLRGEADEGPIRGGLFLRYPSGSGVKQRPDRLELLTVPPGISQHLEAPGLPSDDWVRLTMQVRPDGTSSVEMGGTLLGRGLTSLDLTRHPRWHLLLAGASADTAAQVRSVRISTPGG